MNYLPWIAGGAALGLAARRGRRVQKINPDSYPTRSRQVNAYLASLGWGYRVAKHQTGWSFYVWDDESTEKGTLPWGASGAWYSATIAVPRWSELTLREWANSVKELGEGMRPMQSYRKNR